MDFVLVFADYSLEGPSYITEVDPNCDFPTYTRYCDFCDQSLVEFSKTSEGSELVCPYIIPDDIETGRLLSWIDTWGPWQTTHLGVCENCGFWMLWHDHFMDASGQYRYVKTRAARGVLKKLVMSQNSDAPLAELRGYLKAKFDDRLTIHPQQMEKLVASIYRERGFEVVETVYSKDDGVDIFILNKGDAASAI